MFLNPSSFEVKELELSSPMWEKQSPLHYKSNIGKKKLRKLWLYIKFKSACQEKEANAPDLRVHAYVLGQGLLLMPLHFSCYVLSLNFMRFGWIKPWTV